MTKQSQRIGLVLIALGIAGGTAMAGWKRTAMNFVKIGYEAEGDLGAVRANTASADDLGCQTQVQIDASGSHYYGYCWATDSTGRKLTCFSDKPDMVRQMATLQGDSYLRFLPAEASGSECKWVVTSAASDYRPKSI